MAADAPPISPVLFLTVEGEPMSFYLRPGSAKQKLLPLIRAGGGALCGVQRPGAILLTDPEERGSIPAQSAHWYVSTQYIRDCVEKGEQLELEDYRLIPEAVQSGSPKLAAGRSSYTPEEDEAILKYVSKHKEKVGGNVLWQEMEKQRVTSHTWQSMKYRYKVRLAQRLAQCGSREGDEQKKVMKEEPEDGETTHEAAVQEPCEEAASDPESADPPEIDSSETQIDVPPETSMNTPTKSVNPEVQPPPMSGSSEGEDTGVIPPTDEQAPEKIRAAAAAGRPGSSPPPAQGAHLEVQSQTQSESSKSPSEQLFGSPASKKSKKDGGELWTLRRSLRRQPEPEETYVRRLRSSLTFVEKPPTSRKSNPPRKSSHRKEAAVEERPPKRTRGTGVTLESPEKESPQLENPQNESTQLENLQVEGQQLENPQLESPEKENPQLENHQLENHQLESPEKENHQLENHQLENPQLESTQLEDEEVEGGEDDTAPPAAEEPKKVEKRKLGIFELATKEFDDESEDEARDLQTPAGPAEPPPASSEEIRPSPGSPETAFLTLTDSELEPEPESEAEPEPEPGPSLQHQLPEAQTSMDPHLCGGDKDSQEDESQSIISTRPAEKIRLAATKDEELSPSKIQLEEDKQKIAQLMSRSKQDLASVVKALLKASGDFSLASNLLQDPSSFSGPVWSRRDDDLLLSGDHKVHQQLLTKYGEEDVARRRGFLEAGSV